MQVSVDKGCVSVTTVTPAAPGGFFFVPRDTRTTTYRSPKPAGYWKTFLGRLLKGGRDIRDAELKVRPDGTMVMEAPDGTVVCEPLADMVG